MKVKEIDRTANIAWSPAQQFPVYIAAGTAAQQLDATFSTNAALELYLFNPENKGVTCKSVSAAAVNSRFNKVVWGCHGMGHGGGAISGLIVGAMDNGLINVWDAARLLQDDDGLLHTLSKAAAAGGSSSSIGGNGSVTSLDFNPFKPNLLASGGSESEILIWDMEKTSSPMAPGAKSQPLDEVTCLAWNRQVQHILASTLSSRCVVWDLRKNEPIIKISDSMSRIKSKTVVWHPEVATQMCLSSEDDHTPVIQLWDLRYAASPVRVLEKHERGVLSMAWCHKDADLLLSCSKDNRVLCWNPNSTVPGGEVVYELPSNQWCFDVQWCPRNPQVISASSFEGHIGIYTLMGGEIVNAEVSHTHSKIADSFGSLDDALHTPKPKVERHIVPPLAKAPKWLKRPCGVSFGFGGKLVTFADEKPTVVGENGSERRSVVLSAVVTEQELLDRSNQLEQAVGAGQHREYCAMKAANSEPDSLDQQLWSFMQANFDADASKSFLHLLGFDESQLVSQVKSMSLQSSANKSADTTLGGSTDGEAVDDPSSSSAVVSSSSTSNHLSSASHTSTNSACSGGDDDSSAFDNIVQPPERPVASSGPAAAAASAAAPLLIQCDTGSSVGLLTRALLTGNIQLAVDICLRDERMADAMILAASQGPELFERTMRQYFARRHDVTSKLISSVVNRKYADIVRTCSLDSWKEALALVLTYAGPEDLRPLCDVLGTRLENERSGELSPQAVLCYICSGNVGKFVDAWQSAHGGGGGSVASSSNSQPLALQDLVEKVTLLRRAVAYRHGSSTSTDGGASLNRKLAEYGELLASQGNLQVALAYLSTGATAAAYGDGLQAQSNDLGVLCHRVARALGQQSNAPWRQQPLAAQTKAAVVQASAHAPARPTLSGQQQPKQQQPVASVLQGSRMGAPTGGGSSSSSGAFGGSSAAGHSQHVGASPFGMPAAAAAPVAAAAATGSLAGQQASPASAGYYGGAMPGSGMLYPATGSAVGGGYQLGVPASYDQQHAAAVPSTGMGYVPQLPPAGVVGGGYSPWQQQSQQPSGHVVTRGHLAQKYAATQPTAAAAPAAQPLPASVYNPAAATVGTSGFGSQSSAFSPAAPADVYGSAPATLSPAPLVPLQPAAVSYAPASSEEPQYDDRRVPAGWNDPPPFSPPTAASAKKKDSAAAAAAAAAVQPVYAPVAAAAGGMGDQNVPLAPASLGSHYYNPNEYQQQLQQQQQQPSPSTKEGSHESASQAQHPKAPIPSEHQVLCEVFNSLAYKCHDSADSLQTKKKLEVVLTELELLYDRLREYQLSQSVLVGLHQIAQATKASDYGSALSVVAAVIAQGNFSEIGAFMPGLKMLLQTAQRLHVYL